jgi:hypothetical protein
VDVYLQPKDIMTGADTMVPWLFCALHSYTPASSRSFGVLIVMRPLANVYRLFVWDVICNS